MLQIHFDILVISLSVLYNYFLYNYFYIIIVQQNLFLDLYLAKFLDTSAKLFFCR